jgi:beta propeller repeat protein
MIYEDKIVWYDMRNGNFDIFLYDLTDYVEIQISTNTKDQMYPVIYENWIAWQDYRSGTNWDIYITHLDWDKDGVYAWEDEFPDNPNEYLDTDSDGIGDNLDPDADNDGVFDVNDAFPLDPTENFDFDNDGIGDNADTDDDNDLIPDSMDLYPYNPLNDIEITMDDLLLNLSSVNSTLSDDIQDLLVSITADVIGMNASLSDELTPLLNDMTTDSNALRTWLELVLSEMDANLTATNNSLAYLAKWEDVLTKLDALDQALQDGNQQLQTSIDDVSTDKAEDKGIGLVEVLLVVVLVVLVIDLVATIMGGRGGRAGRLETRSIKQVGNVSHTEGGSEREETAEAQQSAPSTIRTRNRAVSSRDYEEHALGEPEITRARADSEYSGGEEITAEETESKAKENEAEE